MTEAKEESDILPLLQIQQNVFPSEEKVNNFIRFNVERDETKGKEGAYAQLLS